MRLEEHFESRSTLQRNERVKLAASFWNNVGAGMVIGGMAGAFFLDKPADAWAKIGIAIGRTCAWLALLFARQQHADLFAHSTRRAPLAQRAVQHSPAEKWPHHRKSDRRAQISCRLTARQWQGRPRILGNNRPTSLRGDPPPREVAPKVVRIAVSEIRRLPPGGAVHNRLQLTP